MSSPTKSGADASAPQPRHARPYDSVLDTVGWTPLVRLRRVTDGAATPVYGKAEFMSPGSSVKDRIGLAMVEAAEREGLLVEGGTVVEGTGGNTGVALAMVCAIRGYRCVFTMPDKMSAEKVRLLKAYGAEVVITPTAVGPDSPEHYINAAKKIANETPGAFLANQFYNRVNTDAHRTLTGPEIWEQTEGRIRALICGAGTGGTISGAGRFLKEQDESIRVVLADPVGSVYKQYQETGVVGQGGVYLVEGIGGDKIPETMDFDVIDEVRQVTDKESMLMTRRLAREEGILVGGSSGTQVHVASGVAREIGDPDGCVVTFLCDSGERYLSKAHSDEWMRENRLLDVDRISVRYLLDRKSRAVPPLVSVDGGSSLRKALELMREHGITQVPVIEGGECIGSLSESRAMGHVLEQPSAMAQPVAELMESPFPVVHARDSFERVTKLLGRRNRAVLVREGGEFLAVLTRSDCLELLMH